MDTNILRIPIETVINTVLENLIKGGVLLASEKKHYKQVVEAMDGQQLIETLLESHVLAENVKRMENALHIADRKN